MADYIVYHPGDEVLEERRAWQGCPTIACTKGGRLYAGWYTGGMLEPCIHNYNVLVMSDDGGATWSRPILAIYSDEKALERKIDIQLWVDPSNRLWVCWTRSPYHAGDGPATIRVPFDFPYHKEFPGVECVICEDPDAPVPVFGEVRPVCEGFLRNKPAVLRDGRWIFPAYDHIHPDRYYIRVSRDGGLSFSDIPGPRKVGSLAYDETMVYETDDALRMLVRTNEGYIGFSDSFDGGADWTDIRPFRSAPSSRFWISRLNSGHTAFVCNSSRGSDRTGMEIAVSLDGGNSFGRPLLLDGRTSVSYPDLTQDANGNIYIVHDRERDNRIKLDRSTWTSRAAKEILLSRVTEEDILTGTLSRESYTSHVISKALIDSVEM